MAQPMQNQGDNTVPWPDDVYVFRSEPEPPNLRAMLDEIDLKAQADREAAQAKAEAGKAVALHYSTGKPGVDQIPPELLLEWGEVFSYGERKYARDNWKNGTAWHEFYGSLLRHAFRFWMGEDIDPESGCPHLAHVIWNAGTLRYYTLHGLGVDDRKTDPSPHFFQAVAEGVAQMKAGQVTLWAEVKEELDLNDVMPEPEAPTPTLGHGVMPPGPEPLLTGCFCSMDAPGHEPHLQRLGSDDQPVTYRVLPNGERENVGGEPEASA